MINPDREPETEGTRIGLAMHHLRLFVVGDEPSARLARRNLTQLCEEHLSGRYEIEVVDVLTDFRTALASNILVTPTLILIEPEPTVRIVGGVSIDGSVGHHTTGRASSMGASPVPSGVAWTRAGSRR